MMEKYWTGNSIVEEEMKKKIVFYIQIGKSQTNKTMEQVVKIVIEKTFVTRDKVKHMQHEEKERNKKTKTAPVQS